MNDMQNRLADMLKAGTGDPPGRVTVHAVRHQRARRRAAALGLVTAAVAVAVVAAGAGLGLRPGSPHPAAGPALSGGVPHYYVVETSSHGRLTTQVRDTATGAVTGTVRCPWPAAPSLIYPVATDAHQGFFMVCGAATRPGQPPPKARIYHFRVTASGQAREYSLIPGGRLGAVRAGSMAVSPDGSEVAVVVSPPGGPAATAQARIVVIDTRTGAHTIWRNAPPSPRATRFRIGAVSFAAGGRELVFLGTRTCGTGGNPAPCQPGDQQLRALRPAARGGVLSAGRVLLRRAGLNPATQISDAVISADGSVLTVVTVSVPPKPRPSTVTVSQVQVSTRRQRVIYHAAGTSSLYPEVYFSADWSGRHFLIEAGPAAHPTSGRIYNGKLIRLRPFNSFISYGSW